MYGSPFGRLAFERRPLRIQPAALLQTCPAGQLLIPPKLQMPFWQIFAGQSDVPHLVPSGLFWTTQSPLQS